MHLIISTRKLLFEYTTLKIVAGSLCSANYRFWKTQAMIHEHISASYRCYPLHSVVGNLFSEAACCSWWQIVELSQLLAYNNFMKFKRKWEFQVDGVNFIFSLQKISFWYNASFEFFCQILWVYNYFALKRMFSLVIACMKDLRGRKDVFCPGAYLRAVAIPCTSITASGLAARRGDGKGGPGMLGDM